MESDLIKSDERINCVDHYTSFIENIEACMCRVFRHVIDVVECR